VTRQWRAYIIPIDMIIDHAIMAEISGLVEQTFLHALALCEREQIWALWIRDPLHLRTGHRGRLISNS
jgi:hypothetical protein